LLGRNLERLWRSDVPVVPEPSQMDIVSTRTDTDEMEVKDMRRERIPSDKSFDWKTFLHQRALLPEEVSARYAPNFSRIFGDNPRVILRRSLELMHIPEEYIQLILIACFSLC